MPYVQLPSSLKKKDTTEVVLEKEPLPNKRNSKKMPFNITSLGEMDNKPFDINDIKKNYSIKWENFHEVIELFKDIPLENHIEKHTELYTD